MLRSSLPLTSTALALVLSSTAAYADLTAAQVWGDWRDYMQGLGYNVTANETAGSGRLDVDGISVTIPMGAEMGAMTMTMGALGFVENGDGTVDVVMADDMPMSVGFTPEGEDPVTIKMTYTQTGQKMTASGSPEALTYSYAAETLGVILNEVTAEGETVGNDQIRATMTMNNVASQSTMTMGDLRNYVQTMTTGAVTLDVSANPPEEVDGELDFKGQLASMTFQGTSAVPDSIADATDPKALLDAGFAFDGTFEFGAGSSNFMFRERSTNAMVQTSSDGGSLSAAMSPDGLSYGGAQQNVSVNMQLPDLPFPVSFAMAESGFNLAMPIAKADTPQDFALGFNLTNFTMADMIWGIFDPSGQLPRDPATVALDLSGKAKLLVDIMDPMAIAEMENSGAVPGEINSLDVNSLVVDAVGARLTGEGAITFDNTDLTTIPGMPKPVGNINLDLAGANGLLDKIQAMGFIGQEEVMGARMMMGLFGVPGDGPDTLKSTIAFGEDGSISANGQRIR